MNKEILLVVDAVANEKNIEKDVIFGAIERALEMVTARRYDDEVDVKVSIDRATGDYSTVRRWTVVADDTVSESPGKVITLTNAHALNSELSLGDVVEEPVESVAFGRIAAQLAKQVILREIRRAEKADLIANYRSKLNTMISGIVKKINRDNVVLDVADGVEAIMLRDGLLPKEALRPNDRIKGVLTAVREEGRGPMLVMSRTVPQMLKALFKIEVPEISEETITIKAVARDPGRRAKMAVKTNDGRIDPVGACIGIRGSRIQNVSNELGGEHIDVILWDDDPAQLVINAMAPAEIASIVVNETQKRMELAVAEDQLALAIGKNGQNVKLASELVGWQLDVVGLEEAKSREQIEVKNLGKIFVENLGVDEDLAAILVHEGFRTLEDIVYAPADDLLAIEGFDRDLVTALKARARDALLTLALKSSDEVGGAEPAQDLLELPGMTRRLAYLLAGRGIITKNDLADQAVDDISDIEGISVDEAANLIMEARDGWFKN